MKIGIDIGATNTHAVLVTEQGKLITSSKHATSQDIFSGLSRAVKNLFEKSGILPEEVKGIFIGTTELLKALYEERQLANCALVRIGRRHSKVLPALNWQPLLRSFLKEVYFLQSGNRYNGTDSKKPDVSQLGQLFYQIETGLIEAVCIVGTYSPMNEEEELFVKNEIKKRFPDIHITVSHQLGSLGFIERENTALLNTLLSKPIRKVFSNLYAAFSDMALNCPIWFTQSNGTLMTALEAMELPVLMLASGVANSLKGASILSGKRDLISVDVGGSMINIGKVTDGQVREVTFPTKLLGMDNSLAVPEFITLPFGSGSLPSFQNGELQLSTPASWEIKRDGIAWGGQFWTVSDSFLKLYPDSFYDEKIEISKLSSLDLSQCEMVVSYVMEQIKRSIDLLQDPEDEMPVVLVGGGSPLLNEQLFGKYQDVINPAGYPISSAIGACFAPAGEVLDRVYWLNQQTKEEIIEEAIEACKNAVLNKGADYQSIQVSYVEEYPFAYLRGEILRVKTKAAGKLNL